MNSLCFKRGENLFAALLPTLIEGSPKILKLYLCSIQCWFFVTAGKLLKKIPKCYSLSSKKYSVTMDSRFFFSVRAHWFAVPGKQRGMELNLSWLCKWSATPENLVCTSRAVCPNMKPRTVSWYQSLNDAHPQSRRHQMTADSKRTSRKDIFMRGSYRNTPGQICCRLTAHVDIKIRARCSKLQKSIWL